MSACGCSCVRAVLPFALASSRCARAARAADVPYLSGRVVDNAEILSSGDARER